VYEKSSLTSRGVKNLAVLSQMSPESIVMGKEVPGLSVKTAQFFQGQFGRLSWLRTLRENLANPTVSLNILVRFFVKLTPAHELHRVGPHLEKALRARLVTERFAQDL
jgi:hypothetical protein